MRRGKHLGELLEELLNPAGATISMSRAGSGLGFQNVCRNAAGLQHVAPGPSIENLVADPSTDRPLEDVGVLVLVVMDVWRDQPPGLDRMRDDRERSARLLAEDLALDGIEACWLDEDDKRRLRVRFEADLSEPAAAAASAPGREVN